MATQNSTTRFVITFALLVSLACTMLSAATFRVTGEYITVTGPDDSGCVWTYLYAYRSNGSTFLVYDLQDACTGVPIASGTQAIPNAALAVWPTRATLVASVPAGEIQLTLVRNGLFSYTSSGQYRTESPGVVIRSHGTRSEISATTTGTILGYTFGTGAFGNIGSSNDLYVQIVQK